MLIAIVNLSKSYPEARIPLLAQALTILSWGTLDVTTGAGEYSIWHSSWSIDLQAIAWPPSVPVPTGMPRILITDEDGPANVGGQHSVMADGTPIGWVYAAELTRLGYDINPVVSHEYFEMGNNANGRSYAMDDRTAPVKFYPKESCDQANGEVVPSGVDDELGNPIMGANVALASLMDINGKPPYTLRQALNQKNGGDPLAVNPSINGPFKIGPSGYWFYWQDGAYVPIHGSDVPPEKELDT